MTSFHVIASCHWLFSMDCTTQVTEFGHIPYSCQVLEVKKMIYQVTVEFTGVVLIGNSVSLSELQICANLSLAVQVVSLI